MEKIKLDCTYEERTSLKDSSKTYKVVIIKLADNYEKRVYLTTPEMALIENNNKVDSFNYNY